MPIASPYVFISHSSKDNAVTAEIADLLRDNGLNVWVDFDSIESGDRWVKQIQDGVEGAHSLLVIMSRAARESEWVERETVLALQLRIPLYIALIDDTPLPLHLITRQFTDCRDELTTAIKSLVPVIKRKIKRTTPETEPQPLPRNVSPDANENNFFDYLAQMPDGNQIAMIARDLYHWAQKFASAVEFGGGRFTPAFHIKVDAGDKQITVFSVLAYIRTPSLQIPFDYLRKYPPITSRSVRVAFLKRFNELLPESEQVDLERVDRRPTFPLLTAFNTAEELETFKAIAEDLITQIRTHNNT